MKLFLHQHAGSFPRGGGGGGGEEEGGVVSLRKSWRAEYCPLGETTVLLLLYV